MARLSAGDTGAFDEVYDAYRPRVFAFLLRMTRNRALAEDLLDETWLRLVRHATRLLPDTRLGPWLFTVARNLYWSHRRDALLEESFVPELLTLWPSPAPWPSPFDLAAAGELERRVERALSTLSPQYREVVLLVGHEGLTPTDAAVVCGISPEALRQRLSRARAALAEKLRETPAVARTQERICNMTVDRDDRPDDDFLASLARLRTCDVSQRRSRQLRRRCHAMLQAEPSAKRSSWMVDGALSDGSSSRRSAARGVSRTSWRSSAAPRRFTATLAPSRRCPRARLSINRRSSSRGPRPELTCIDVGLGLHRPPGAG